MINGMRLARIGALALLTGFMSIGPSFAKDIKIGVLMPRTGRYAETGLSVGRGIEMVVKDINASGGIKSLGGAKIDLVVADDGSDPTKASLEARRLMSEEKVSFVLGPYSTPEAQAFMPVADRYQIGGVGLQTTLIPTTPYFSTISISAEGFGKGYADLVHWLNGKGAKIGKVVITYANNDYGQVVSKTATAALTAQGVKVLEAIPVEPNVRDMTPIVLRVKSLAPDAVISVVYFQDGVLLHKARFNLGYADPIWIGGSAGFSDDKLWETLGAEVAQKTLTDSFGLAFYSADGKLPGLKDALARGKAAFPDHILDQSFMFGVQAARMLVRAIDIAGVDDPVKINTAFRGLKLKAGDPAIVLPIISGDLSYNENGTLAGTSPIFVQWKDGKKHIVYPESVASEPAVIQNHK
ncbi:ABC transporter substrate-binding protein [uncultured Bradyrhizobium sp.]|uniref:ABC transporter substrate-binding protein n=1 Tax=uncultured Bradyrhizobium sp. TaxID=199684 RepID=UPI00261BCC64|nr:ABC transporter substrate-binding protein [uncultured Bradyrhizobium sp.]